MNESESGIEKITDSIGDLMTGVPSPIRKNFFKAFGRLCTALVDIPVAKMESSAAEIRANSSARIEIIKKEGQVISEKLNIPHEYITKASEKFASKIIKEQLNIDQIGINAAINLSKEKYTDYNLNDAKEISDDWLNEFENYAKLKSSDEMKFVFGKILSGEICRPSKYSIKTLRTISQLDNEAAELFQKFCSICICMQFPDNLIIDARCLSFEGSADTNSLKKYGFPFAKLNILEEYGLIASQYNTQADYFACIANENMVIGASLKYRDKEFGLVPKDGSMLIHELKLNGVRLTESGKQLLDIVPKIENINYDIDLRKYLDNLNLSMKEIN
ncbi:MAG: hypothetical protein H6Q17_1626 [Bacteroidetes bacterium]|nr:hypothetical protein [Bacteroidota bacterium]